MSAACLKLQYKQQLHFFDITVHLLCKPGTNIIAALELFTNTCPFFLQYFADKMFFFLLNNL